MKCVDLGKNNDGEGALLGRVALQQTDTEGRELGEQMGLDTPLVLAVNDGHWLLAG